jgi:hypothetical protein
MLTYTIERWNSEATKCLQILATSQTFAEAESAYADAVAKYPSELIMLSHGARVIRKSIDVEL